jgi:hypothetical protein
MQSDIGTGTESAVDIWLTRAGDAAPDVLSPATARLAHRATFLKRDSQQSALIGVLKRTSNSRLAVYARMRVDEPVPGAPLSLDVNRRVASTMTMN